MERLIHATTARATVAPRRPPNINLDPVRSESDRIESQVNVCSSSACSSSACFAAGLASFLYLMLGLMLDLLLELLQEPAGAPAGSCCWNKLELLLDNAATAAGTC